MFRRGSIHDPELEAVYNTAQKFEAEMAKQILEQNRIPAMLRDREDSGEYLRILGYGSPFGVDILVRKDQAVQARKLLKETFSEEKGITDEELEALAMEAGSSQEQEE